MNTRGEVNKKSMVSDCCKKRISEGRAIGGLTYLYCSKCFKRCKPVVKVTMI